MAFGATSPAVAHPPPGNQDLGRYSVVPSLGQATFSPAPSAMRIAVIRVTSGGPTEGLSEAGVVEILTGAGAPTPVGSAARAIYGTHASFAEYVSRQSGATMSVTAVAMTVSVPAQAGECSYSKVADDARAEAARRGWDLSTYTHLAFYRIDNNCDDTGYGVLGGDHSWVGAQTNADPGVAALSDLDIFTHEFGHNLGLHHANLLAPCTAVGGSGAAFTRRPGGCVWREYGDPMSVMGGATLGDLNGFHRQILGWMAPARVASVATTTTLTIAPVSAIGPTLPQNAQMRIAEGAIAQVEFDTSVAGQSTAGGRLNTGVFVRLVRATSGKTDLLDLTPSGPADEMDLVVGQTVALGDEGASIELISTTATEATIRLVPHTVDSAGPSAAEVEVYAYPDGPNADIVWNAASDMSGVALYEVLRDGVVVGTTASRAFTDPNLREGAYAYRVRATDAFGRVGEASQETRMLMPPPDTTAPTGLGDLKGAADAQGYVELSWATAVDGDGSVRYEIFRDATRTSPIAEPWQVDAGRTQAYLLAGGGHRWRVRAVDLFGNYAETQEITVLAAGPPAGDAPRVDEPRKSPNAPRRLTQTPVAGGVRIKWQPVAGATVYRVEFLTRRILTKKTWIVVPRRAGSVRVRTLGVRGLMSRPTAIKVRAGN